MDWFKKHKLITSLVALILIIGIGAAAGGTDNSSDTNNSQTTESQDSKTESPTNAKVGQPVRDGKFEFTVKKVICGKTSLGDQYFNHKAQGEFCLVDVTIENIGDEPQSLFADNQYAFNANGQKYNADSEASVYLDDTAATLWAEINPGNKVTGKIVFDVPKKTKLTKLELHDSAFSNGIAVDL